MKSASLKDKNYMYTLPVSIINLQERTDRLRHILKQFEVREEFDCSILSIRRHVNGRLGLWSNLLNVIKRAKKIQLPFVIFCEDDHLFTGSYSYKNLLKSIREAGEQDAELLLGGVSWFDSAIQISEKLFWLCQFTGLQFAVIYTRFYDTILDAEFGLLDAADIKLSTLSSKKFVIHPFISIQQEFGYSDVTNKNNKAGHVKQLFKTSSATLARLKKVKKFYNKTTTKIVDDDFSDISIPTYVMNFEDNSRLITKIEAQFKGRAEFDITLIKVSRHKIQTTCLWQTIRKIVRAAIDNDDDVIIICEDGHQFTLDYTKEFLIRNIIEANYQGAEILFGNATKLDQITPLTSERYWINLTESSSFFIIYRSLFQKILSSPFKEEDGIFKFLCMLTSHKMVLYPFISLNEAYNDPHKIQNRDEISLQLFKNALSDLKIR